MPAHKAKKTAKRKVSHHKSPAKKHVKKTAPASIPQPDLASQIPTQMPPVQPVVDTTGVVSPAPVVQQTTPDIPAAMPVPDESSQPLESQTAVGDQAQITPQESTPTTAAPEPLVEQDASQITQETITPPAQSSSEPVISKEDDLLAGVEGQTVATEAEPRKKGKIVVFAAFILLIAVLAGGVVVYTKSMSQLNQSAKPVAVTPSVAPTKAATPIVAEVDKTKYEIKVQNGSGISGEAGRVKTVLEADGFKVGSVGNADKSSYTKTLITVTKTVEKGYVDELKKSLSAKYELDDVATASATADDDVVVTVGSTKAK
jgi:hypothetical protein